MRIPFEPNHDDYLLQYDGGSLNLRDKTIRSLPDNLTVSGHLRLDGCKNLVQLPRNLNVKGFLSAFNCTSLLSLPNDIVVNDAIKLENCVSLQTLPSNMRVGGDLDLKNCKSLQSLPSGLVVSDSLWLDGCESLTFLPDDIQIGETLDLDNCRKLKNLPLNLVVQHNLYIRNCGLETLPECLKVHGNFHFDESSPVSKTLPDCCVYDFLYWSKGGLIGKIYPENFNWCVDNQIEVVTRIVDAKPFKIDCPCIDDPAQRVHYQLRWG